ncbi:SdrD B-like domain-containing protein [Schaalia sp. ORNL0103]|uniref:SdrD B-like domain-containing protein n=1 Tax=Schaalia sp. ORNL0103 TaxID=2789426 RepID=UPI001CA5DEF4|nr:SdrD B-like domain-containing protein [Schaalia sp. ORNL0103]MBW6413380.1 carboxypeptidase regulatory-like domain-containing protein [Schaalia sp. ORNL0103]
MSRLRPFRARVGVAGAASLAALSLLVTSLTPLAMRASAADESTQSPDVASSQEAATASSNSEAADAPAAEAGAEAPAAEAGAEAPDAEAGAEAPAAEEAPEDQPRTRRARSTSEKPATLAMTVTNDSDTLSVRENQVTTINYSCSSVTTPCEGASIKFLLPEAVTPAGVQLKDNLYTATAVTGSTVALTSQSILPGPPRMKQFIYSLNRTIPAGTSDRIQITWHYDGNDAPTNSTTTQRVEFTAWNADPVEDSKTTTWTADTDIAIEKSGSTNPNSYPAVGGETTYKLRYGYQQIDQTDPNKVGIRWNGSSLKGGVNGTNFVQVQDIKVVDPLPAQAVFVSATNGGVYDAATHTVTWSYDKWAWQNPIESLVTVKYPEGSVTTADTVTNKATITAKVMNDPSTTLTKSSEITHGFSLRKPGGRLAKAGNDNTYAFREGMSAWRFGVSNTGNTTTHAHFDDTMPCTWSSQDAKAAGGSCDQPTMVAPYRFSIFGKSGYEDKGGWTLEYWTNKGNHEVVNYTETSTLNLPDGEWITRFTIDSDVAPQTNPSVWFYGTIPSTLPTEEPADFASHYNTVAPPEKYYNYVASPDYVRFQNCASGTLTDKDSGQVVASADDLCTWMRVRQDFPSVGVVKVARTNPVTVGKTASFGVNGIVRKKSEGGKPTPFTLADLLPEGFDIDDASQVSIFSSSPLTNPDGSKYDVSKVQIEITKNYNGSGRTLLRMIVPDPVEGNLYTAFNTTVKNTAPAGQTTNDANAYMPGDGAKATTEDKSLRNTNYCLTGRVQDTFDVNGNGSTEDYVCYATANFNVATTPAMSIAKEVKGNKDADFVPAGDVAKIDPGSDGAYRFTIANAGNAPLTKVVAYDILPHPGDTGVGPASSQARGSSWQPFLNSTNWTFQSIKEKSGQDPETSEIPASDITIQYTTVENPCRGEVMSVGGAMNDGPAGCTPDAWGAAPADLKTVKGFRLVMNRDIEVGEKIQFVATMTSPVNANLIAWNSVAMSGGVTENGKVSYLQPNEAPKVGINVSTDVSVTKKVARVKVNGDQPVMDANGIPETIESTDPVMPGDYMLYSITLNNKGPAVASGMKIKDVLPQGIEAISTQVRLCQTDATTPCVGVQHNSAPDLANLDTDWEAMPSGQLNTNLAVNGTQTLYVLVKVSEGSEGKTITNTATLGEFDQVDSNPDNNTDSATFKVGGSISGTIYNDTDATWINDRGIDKPFEGVTVRLLDANGNPVKDSSGADITATTDANGNYTFNRLPLGDYKVEVVPDHATVDGENVSLSDYTQTYGYQTSTKRSEAGKGNLTTPTISLTTSNANVSKVDFGFVKPASVGNFVWFDANKDGVQDADEVGVAGVTVTLTDGAGNPVIDLGGNPVKPVTTDANGKYEFTNLMPNVDRIVASAGEENYKVTFTVPAGYSATKSYAALDDEKDSNGTESSVTLTEGQNDETVDFGLIADGTIGDTLFWDVDNNGGSEPSGADKPLAGVTVKLTYTTPAGVEKTLTTVTDENGKYSFKDLAPGDYVVTVDKASLATVCPECTAQTHAPSGDLTASEGQELSLTSKVTLSPGAMTNNDQDWAFTGSADTAIKKAITTPSAEEQGTFDFAPGKEITYSLTLTNNGPSVATGVTASDKLPAGVTFVSAEGDGSYNAETGKWDLSNLTIAKDEVKTITITVRITGEGVGSLITNVATITHQDQVGDDPTNNESSASFKGGYNLGGTIYRDSDASYSKSDSEQRFKGVTVALLNEDGTPVLDSEGKPMTATTDEKGAYQFVGLAPASYRVVIVDPDKGDLAGLIPTQAYTGKGATEAAVTITDASVQGVDFGLVAPATIGDRVWNDKDGNGADNGEPGVPGVTVILKDANGVEVGRTTTDANGNYRFTGLVPGTYTVDIEVPAGFNAATTSMTVTVGEGEENLNVDFPLTVIPTPTPATTVAKVLARTGSDASVLGGMAAMAAIAGIAALAGKRRREREDA